MAAWVSVARLVMPARMLLGLALPGGVSLKCARRAAVGVGVPVWLEGAADVGTVAAGLALPLAFFSWADCGVTGCEGRWSGWRRGRSRRSGCRGTRAGVWWSVSVFVRNGSELPVFVDSVDVDVRPWGDTSCRPCLIPELG